VPLRDIAKSIYVPYLELRPAEMIALEELPEKDKDLMFPLFKLRPWLGSTELSKSIEKLLEVYGRRPCFLTLCDAGVVETRRSVHDELDALRFSADGFAAWCEFFEKVGHEHFVPSLQLSDPGQFDAQLRRLFALSRGLIVVLEQAMLPFLRIIAERTAQLTNGGMDVLFLMDFGKQNVYFSMERDRIMESIRTLGEVAPAAKISLSASSFPEAFTGLTTQKIFERQVFNQLQLETDGALIYSDRGSARAERQLGGGAAPAARVDYATADDWFFYRDDTNQSDRQLGYKAQAQNLIKAKCWDAGLRLWGTQMIERTALGDSLAITSPNRSTAVRINIHLHQQLFYGDAVGAIDTEEEWSD
jgi:T4 beta protein